MEPVAKRRKQEKPPAFGIRLNTADGDTKITKVYESLRSLFAKQESLQEKKSDCRALWIPPDTFAVVVESKGKVMHAFGTMRGASRVLELEEALYLMERGTLSVEDASGRQCSIEELYAALPIPLSAYIVFSRLRRAGYNLHRPLTRSSIPAEIPASVAASSASGFATAQRSDSPPASGSTDVPQPDSGRSVGMSPVAASDVEMTSEVEGGADSRGAPKWLNDVCRLGVVGEYLWEVHNSDAPGEIHVLDPDASVDIEKLEDWAQAGSVVSLVEGSEVGHFVLEKYVSKTR